MTDDKLKGVKAEMRRTIREISSNICPASFSLYKKSFADTHLIRELYHGHCGHKTEIRRRL